MQTNTHSTYSCKTGKLLWVPNAQLHCSTVLIGCSYLPSDRHALSSNPVALQSIDNGLYDTGTLGIPYRCHFRTPHAFLSFQHHRPTYIPKRQKENLASALRFSETSQPKQTLDQL